MNRSQDTRRGPKRKFDGKHQGIKMSRVYEVIHVASMVIVESNISMNMEGQKLRGMFSETPADSSSFDEHPRTVVLYQYPYTGNTCLTTGNMASNLDLVNVCDV